MKKDVKNQLINIAKEFNLDLFILFGSRAKNLHTKNSDFDFAYYSKRKLNWQQHKSLINKISDILSNDKIDLININETHDPLLKKDILIEGVCIYEKRKNLFENIGNQAWFEYIDFKPNYKILKEIIKERMEST